ncbi:MAG: T9SS type A sorting domain-containing protein [Bacteroidetes bacterium]|nr:T9SS type A sorting domain-containing protein [Bacteroidota bacterium]
MNSLAVSGTNIFAGTFGGVFTSTLSDIITDVKEISNSIPNNFVLSQNYPNPFNPSTNINFSVPLSSFVSVKVYDVLGKEVASLVNEELKAGSYKFNFNAKGLTSGVYFYRVTAGNFTQTKKMILLR